MPRIITIYESIIWSKKRPGAGEGADHAWRSMSRARGGQFGTIRKIDQSPIRIILTDVTARTARASHAKKNGDRQDQ